MESGVKRLRTPLFKGTQRGRHPAGHLRRHSARGHLRSAPGYQFSPKAAVQTSLPFSDPQTVLGPPARREEVPCFPAARPPRFAVLVSLHQGQRLCAPPSCAFQQQLRITWKARARFLVPPPRVQTIPELSDSDPLQGMKARKEQV